MKDFIKKELLLTYDGHEDEGNDTWEWYAFSANFQHIIDRLRIKYWFVYGNALTWRRVFGYQFINNPANGQILHNCIPKTSYLRAEVHSTDDPKVIALTWYHHDAPTGETMYLLSQRKGKKLYPDLEL